MQTIHNLSEQVPIEDPVVLTIGNFDGLHPGHRTVLNRAKELAQNEKRQLAVLTFANHPSQILRPDQPVPLICTLNHKIHLLEKIGVDFLLLLPFTKEVSQYSAETFLQKVYGCLPFDFLVLGRPDTTLGKDRQGGKEQIQLIAHRLGFTLEFTGAQAVGDTIFSSSQIRKLIQQGNFIAVERLLGRKYSIHGPVIKEETNTIWLDVTGLCLPPEGSYPVQWLHNGQQGLGAAELTKRELKVVLAGKGAGLLGCHVEVVF